MATDESTAPGTPSLTPWDRLDSERQLALRVAYGEYLDTLPPTCSLEEKDPRFARWLAEQGVFLSDRLARGRARPRTTPWRG